MRLDSSNHGPSTRPTMKRRPSVVAISAIHSAATSSKSIYNYSPVANGFESLNYDDAANEAIKHKSMLGSRAKGERHAETLITWAAVIFTGFFIGCIAFSSSYAVSLVVQSKFSLIEAAVARHDISTGWLIMSAFITGLALLAAVLTRWAPEAAGSGIPHVKAYLNGVRLDGALRPRTLVAKVIGVSCCVACGMPAGREGPMVHTGAIVANIFGVARSRVLAHWGQRSALRHNGKASRTSRATDYLYNDYDRRNFVSMGAAAGVAAAFHAPIGGILFALEEVSSYWNANLTVLTFFMVIVSAFTVMLWTDGIYGTFSSSGLVLFWESGASGGGASSGSLSAEAGRRLAGGSGNGRSPFAMWELLLFLCISVMCGLLGALFNQLSKRITVVRKRVFASILRWRVVEAVLSIWLIISIFYLLPLAMPCRSADEEIHGMRIFDVGRPTRDPHGIYIVPYQCKDASGGGNGSDGSEPNVYNDLATLLMQPQESAIKQLFSRGTAGYFSPTCLGVFIVLYFLSAVFLYGIAVPSGLFVPGMLIGGGIGRFVGECIYLLPGATGVRSDPGVYATIGAAAMLGGITRMTMSLAVILVELTNDIDLLLPVMLTIGISKQVGDLFTRSVYDIHIGLQGVPMLEERLDHVPTEMQGALNAKSVMTQNVVCVSYTETATRLAAVLNTTTHHAFPIVDHGVANGVWAAGAPQGSAVFSGIIARSKIQHLLEQQQQFARSIADAPSLAPSSAANGDLALNTQTARGDREATAVRNQEQPERGKHRRSSSAPAESPPASPKLAAIPGSPNLSASPGYPPELPGLGPALSPPASPPNAEALAPHAISPWMSAEEEPLIDLRPHCDRAPYVVHELLPMHRVFRLFQTMGLRHLPVIDQFSHLVGIITRKDLLRLDERSLKLLANKRRAESWRRHEERGLEEVRSSRHGGTIFAGLGPDKSFSSTREGDSCTTSASAV